VHGAGDTRFGEKGGNYEGCSKMLEIAFLDFLKMVAAGLEHSRFSLRLVDRERLRARPLPVLHHLASVQAGSNIP
jgi:hypothetical protein